jgi:UDP-GlcNAc:undecaprenyl-phosphate/decaprenyl-phosphate GlcNAc-1-phosphate transferase
VIYLPFALLISLVASVALCALVRRGAPAIGAVVPPRPDRWHSEPTPTMGGVAIAAATVLGFAAIVTRVNDGVLPSAWLPIAFAGIAMFVVGVLDDRLQLSPLAKLVSSLIVGAFLVFSLARRPDNALPLTHTLVATIWFAGVCHAFNLLDNMDGLAAGVALVAAGFLAWLLGPSLGTPIVVLLVALCGALAGFLYWNRPPARLFMGDCGSLFLGAVLAGASLVPVLQERTAFPWTSMLVVVILVVPLFDTGFVLVLRRFAGRSATRGGTDHVSHRLVSLGFSERSAVRILYLLGVVGGLTAWALVTGGIEQMIPVAALFAVLVTLIGIYLARVPAYNAQDFKALERSAFAPLLKDLTFKWHAGEVMLDLVLITACYYFAYRLRFEGEDLAHFFPYFTASLPVVLGCKLASLYGSGLYQRSWETFSLRDMAVVVRGVFMGSMLSVLAAAYFYRFEGFSRVVFIIDALLLLVAIVATRASFRSMSLVAASRSKRSRRILVYGAGAFGQLIVREMRANPDWRLNPVAFIDDDPMKARRWIMGVPVRGALDSLEATMRRYKVEEVILSSPSINGSIEHTIREVCLSLECPVRRLHMSIQ